MSAAQSKMQNSHALLLQRRAELRDRLVRLRVDLRRDSEPLSPDFAEQASERETEEVLNSLYVGTSAELDAVNHALERIADGSYGFCDKCGGPIEPDRLAAVPQAEYCGRCAQSSRR